MIVVNKPLHLMGVQPASRAGKSWVVGYPDAIVASVILVVKISLCFEPGLHSDPTSDDAPDLISCLGSTPWCGKNADP